MAQGNGESASTGTMVQAGTIQGPALAEEARTRLDAAGITASLQTESGAARGDGVELGLLGDVAIMVPPADVERARHIIAEVSHAHHVHTTDEGGDRD